VEDYGAWLRNLVTELSDEGWETRFRPHPQMVARNTVDKYGNLGPQSPGGELSDDLRWADMVAAMNSNGLMQAYMGGLETRAWNKGTMLSPLMVAPGKAIPTEGKYEWASRLAYCQWTYDELEDGTWLKYHEPIMRRLVEGGPAYPWCDHRI